MVAKYQDMALCAYSPSLSHVKVSLCAYLQRKLSNCRKAKLVSSVLHIAKIQQMCLWETMLFTYVLCTN